MESLGTYLKLEREYRGMSLAEVSAVTRVPEVSLHLIERDLLDDLPGEVFVRGFLRAYAQCLGLDAEEIVNSLNRPAPRPTLPLMPPSSRSLSRRRIATPALLFVLLLACLLAVIVFWRPLVESPFSAHVPPPISGNAG